MLTSRSREKHVANCQCHDVLDVRLAVMHVDRAVENCKYLFTIVYMPFVRLVSPWRRVVVPPMLAISSAPQARLAVKSLLRTTFIDGRPRTIKELLIV